MSVLGLDPLPRGVILAATPLGNVGDASARLMHALQHADVIAAEDTRRVRNLAQALGIEISGRVVSNFDHNEKDRAQQLIDAAAGELAGKPRYTVSDFGRFTPNHGRPTTLLVCD